MSKVLLVDNETSRAAAIGESLERGGFETISATDGNEALRTFLNEVPDLVMVGPLAANPDEDFCRRMRETRPGIHAPIILYCEALAGDALKAALEHSGCNVYLEMPTSDERLFEVCRHALVEAVGSTAKAVPAGVSTAAASEPSFPSPDAATADLETSGQDIDAHLDSMFDTGAPPVAEWTAEPEISFDTDMAAESAEPVPTPPLQAEERPAPAAFEQPDLGDEVELVGFESDTMAFEQAGENAAGIQPDIASEAHSLVDDPEESAPPAAEAGTRGDATQIEVTPPTPAATPEALHVDADSPAAAVDFGLGEAARHEELPPIELVAEPVKGSSRGWVWGLVAAAALGGIATFAIFRPSGETTEPAPVAARPAVTTTVAENSNPLVETQPAADAALVAQLDPVAAEPAGNDVANTDAVAAADPTSEIAETPSDTTNTAGSDIEEAAAETIAVETTNAGPETAEINTPPEPTAIAATVPAEPAVAAPAPTPAPPKPNVHDEFVFQPSTEIVDAATAGEGFTPPASINRELPVYKAADVPAGGETVVLRVLVNDWGKAVRVDVEKGRRGSPLVDAAIDAVLNTRYTPADLRGQQVRAWATETFIFE